MDAQATCFIEESLDDLLREAIDGIVETGEEVAPTKGTCRELRAVTLQLRKPRARLSRSENRGKVFSALGELLWYLSGSGDTDFITYYIPDYEKYDEDGTIFGAYGPRLRGDTDQLSTVISLLRKNPSTRRAVIQLFDRRDLLEYHHDVPCTCTLQFLNRENHLDLVVNMRSNDAYIGLPHDVFCFSMIQEIVARSIGSSLGQYIHFAGSLHVYDKNVAAAREFLGEGCFAISEMPEMPGSDPLPAVNELLGIERTLREGSDPGSVQLPSDPYWADLARLLVVFSLVRSGRREEIDSVVDQMDAEVYRLHIHDRLDKFEGK